MFRINSIKFHNFRNILDSEVLLNEKGFETALGGIMVGFYGTNGSSKSSVGYALSYFSKLTCGFTYAFFHQFDNDFGVKDTLMSLEYDFDYEDDRGQFTGLIIGFEFKKGEDGTAYISKENIRFKTKKGRQPAYTVLRSDNFLTCLISPDDIEKLRVLFSSDVSLIYSLNSFSIQNKCSFFLNAKGLTLASKNTGESKTFSEQFLYLNSFLKTYISNTSFIMPDSYGLSITNNLFTIIAGDTLDTGFIAKEEPSGYFTCDEERLQNIEKVIETSNNFMSKLIKGFKVIIDKKEVDVEETGKKKYKIRLFASNKDGVFSFENESEGIKKLFLIASAIAKVMNQSDYILFIDEFDEGVFEVLFGDIIASINDQCMGQFLFTSHNLRPLEMMSYTHFVFSTTNPKKRFVTLKGIKPKNNLRDVYIKKIMYGDDNELSTLIDEQDILEGLIYGD